jgi:exosome complex component RRP40
MLALTLNLQNFLIDIKGPALAFLPVLAFEGGTRRNIPKFEVHTH